jgi:hypothetical protein
MTAESVDVQVAAGMGAALFLLIAVFQALLALGLPLGEFAWGGKNRIPPKNLRVASAVVILLYLFFGAIVLDHAQLTAIGLGRSLTGKAVWGLTGFFGLGILMNLASRSRKERIVMTPVAALCFAACLYLALHA